MNWWVVLGGGAAGRSSRGRRPGRQPTRSKSGHLGRKRLFFPPFLHHFCFFILESHDLFHLCPSDCRRRPGAPRPPARSPLCPGLVCEVGMTIAATFQPTSQGCCGDTVLAEMVSVASPGSRRRPPSERFLCLCPAPASLTCSPVPSCSPPLPPPSSSPSPRPSRSRVCLQPGREH